VSARGYASSTRPICLGICCVTHVSRIHTPTHSPSSECVVVRKRCGPHERREAGIFSFKRHTHSRDDNSSSGTPRARTNSRVLGGVCTSVHILIVGASRVAKVENPAIQAVHAGQPREIRVNPRKFREIRREFHLFKSGTSPVPFRRARACITTPAMSERMSVLLNCPGGPRSPVSAGSVGRRSGLRAVLLACAWSAHRRPLAARRTYSSWSICTVSRLAA
jgi:hypothetical protein